MLSIKDSNDNFQGTPGFKPLNVVVNQDTLSKNSSDAIGSAIATAELISSNKPNNNIDKTYYLNLIIENNTFVYSTSNNKPELLLRVSKKSTGDSDFNLVNTLPDGTNTVTITNRAGNQVTGFDITTKTGIINIANPEIITASTDANGVEHPSKDEWKIELIFVNYNESQNGNAGKKFKSNIELGTDEMGVKSALNTMEVHAPKNLSDGTPITSYTYKIKEMSSTGEYEIMKNQPSNIYTYTGLSEETNYNILVEGTAKNQTETVLNSEVSTLKLTLANQIIYKVPKVTSGPGLYHHNGTFKDSNGNILDANDGNYRYAGKSENVNNHVCLGSNLRPCPEENQYRIIGVFNGKVKLIKKVALPNPNNILWNAKENTDDNGKYNKWEYTKNGDNHQADINAYLNNTWITSLGNNVQKIMPVKWQIGGLKWNNFKNKTAPEIYQTELGGKLSSEIYTTSSPTKVGLMYISDYMYAASRDKWTLYAYDNNGSFNSDHTEWNGNDYSKAYTEDWMYTNDNQWTISRGSSNEYSVYSVASRGSAHGDKANSSFLIRPVFYLNHNIRFSSGTGTETDPFII